MKEKEKNRGQVCVGNGIVVAALDDLILVLSSSVSTYGSDIVSSFESGPESDLRCNRGSSGENDNDDIDDGSIGIGDNNTIKPWTLCTSWEPCSIGTIPGYPS